MRGSVMGGLRGFEVRPSGCRLPRGFMDARFPPSERRGANCNACPAGFSIAASPPARCTMPGMARRVRLDYACASLVLVAISTAASIAAAEPGRENPDPVRQWPDVPALIRILDAPLTEREQAGLFDPDA